MGSSCARAPALYFVPNFLASDSGAQSGVSFDGLARTTFESPRIGISSLYPTVDCFIVISDSMADSTNAATVAQDELPVRPAANATEQEAVQASAPTTTKQSIDPYNVKGEVNADGTVKAIDYTSLVNEFGTKLIDNSLLDRFERVTKHKPHRFLRRGIVFSHRDLELILDRYEKGEPFFLYTGRGPSSDSMHIGHSVPFAFTKWLQDVFDVPLGKL